MKTEVDLTRGTVTLTFPYVSVTLTLAELLEADKEVRYAMSAARENREAKQDELDAHKEKIEEQITSARDTSIRALVAQYAYRSNQPPVEAREVYSYCRNWVYPMSQDELRQEVEAAFIQARAADGTTSAKSMLERARCLATCYRVFHIDSVG